MARIVDTQPVRLPAAQVDFLQLIDSREIVAPDVLRPEDHAKTAPPGLGQDLCDDIELAVIGSAGRFRRDARVFVVGRVDRCEVPAVEAEIVLLLAVIGKRLARNLPARDAAS